MNKLDNNEVHICEQCGKEHDGSYGSGRFCSRSCSTRFSALHDTNSKIKFVKCVECGKVIPINKHTTKNTINKIKCDDCNNKNCNVFYNIDCENCFFRKNNICISKCSISQKVRTLNKYCNLKITNDYFEYLQNYFELKTKFQSMLNSGLSSIEILNTFNNHSRGGMTILKILQCKTRSLSEAISNAYFCGKLKCPDFNYGFHTEYHITWDGNKVFLRSSYETKFAKELDEKKIKYQVEPFRVKYFNTLKNRMASAIPDFYLPETNMIVEIKSTWTLNLQEMKDKVKAYKNNGYNFKLILDHKEVDIETL